MDAITADEERGLYTADRLLMQRPEIYQATVELLGRDVPIRQIAKILHIHHRSVAAVKLREPAAIDTARLSLGRKCGLAATLLVEKIIEEPDSIPANVRGLVAAQLIDKAQLLSGGATSRPDTMPKPGDLSHDDFAAWVDSLPSAAPAPAMGLGGGDPGQMARPAGAESEAPKAARTDRQSVASQRTLDGDTHGATERTGDDQDAGSAIEGSAEGGGGGRKIAPGPRIHTR